MYDKKIFLVTRRAGFNFGSSLQAFALQQIFIKKGYPCEILDIEEMHLKGKFRIFILDLLGGFFNRFPFIRFIVGKKIYTLLKESFIQRKKFNKFNTETLIVSKPLHGNKLLSNYIGKGNLVICGSDQIWNPIGFSPNLFLSFVNPKENMLVSYAPSIGLNKLTSHQDEIKFLVNRFHHISVREEAGVNILSSLTSKKINLVLDPTLVADRSIWSTIEEPIGSLPSKYILCYFLSTNNHPNEYIFELKKKFGCEIINIQTNYSKYYMEGAINRSDIGPENFLFLIKNAHYICTNSFHCCIFSHIYKKNYSVFSRFEESDKANQNSRIQTLLKILNDENRWIGRLNTEEDNKQSCILNEDAGIKISNDFINLVLKDFNEAHESL